MFSLVSHSNPHKDVHERTECDNNIISAVCVLSELIRHGTIPQSLFDDIYTRPTEMRKTIRTSGS